MAEIFDITDDAGLKTAVRAETQYADNADELPDADLDEIVNSAKRRLFLETGSKAWYSDTGLGHALVAYTAMRAKSAVENIPLSGYELGDEQVTMKDVDPETSQQIQQWADDVRAGLNASDLDNSTRPTIRNSSSYIGRDEVRKNARRW